MNDVAQLITKIEEGDSEAAEALLPLVYDELRKLAAQKLAQEKPGQTLQATALVHESYLRLLSPVGEGQPQWKSRGHFFAAAAVAMRRILVENARRKKRVKHGGECQRTEMIDPPAKLKHGRLVALDEALDQLALEDTVAARIVELRYFAGLGHEAIANGLNMTVYAVRQKWTYARAWLKDALSEQ